MVKLLDKYNYVWFRITKHMSLPHYRLHSTDTNDIMRYFLGVNIVIDIKMGGEESLFQGANIKLGQAGMGAKRMSM